MARAWACIAVWLAICTAAGSASASFPGRNGAIGYLWRGESAYRAGPTATSIRAVDPRTGVVRVLHDCPLQGGPLGTYAPCSVRAPSYAPGGARLAFPVTRATQTPQGPQSAPALVTMAPDGTAVEEHVAERDYIGVSWSPARDRLLLEPFPGTSPARAPILLASLDAKELTELTVGQHADWSSTGQIAFDRYLAARCLPGCVDIFVTRVGRTPRRLTFRGGQSPSWSPHGSMLAFVRKGDVYIVSRDGRGLKRLTRRGGSDPAWSPNGRWIAFIRNGDLYVVRPNGQDRRRVLDSPRGGEFGEGPGVEAIGWQPLPSR
jgi:hypothetical protein